MRLITKGAISLVAMLAVFLQVPLAVASACPDADSNSPQTTIEQSIASIDVAQLPAQRDCHGAQPSILALDASAPQPATADCGDSCNHPCSTALASYVAPEKAIATAGNKAPWVLGPQSDFISYLAPAPIPPPRLS